MLAACAALERDPVPEPLVGDASVAGFGVAIRSGGDVAPPNLEEDARVTLAAFRDAHAAEIADGEPVRLAFLALSGGGDGAFGAGLLDGWTEAGGRPEFQIVTGVSTGAIVAPFAFLGPDYDDELRRAYTGIGPDDVYVVAILNLLSIGVQS